MFPTAEIVGLIYQLLPGFLTAWIYYGLTAHEPKSPFERTVQALIFTCIIKAVVYPIAGLLWLFDLWNQGVEIFLSTLTGAALGVLFSYCANNNSVHEWLRNCIQKSDSKITKRTSYPSEWFSAFNRHRRFVYLHLKPENDDDHRNLRVFGWPEEWPDSPNSGHFVLMFPEWVDPLNNRTKLCYTERMLIPADQVRLVEFEVEDVFAVAKTLEKERKSNDGSESECEAEQPKPIEHEPGSRVIEQRSTDWESNGYGESAAANVTPASHSESAS